MQDSIAVNKLDRKHPTYDQYAISWENIDLLSEGGIRLQQHMERFLIKRMKELFDVYQERIKRFSYTPNVGTCVGWYEAALFRRAPEIDIPGNDDFYTSFLSDCNRNGVGYVDLWRRIYSLMLLMGRGWVMVDCPKANEQPASLLEERELGLDQAYCVVYDPRQIINWGVNQFGEIDWVLTKTLEQPSDFLGDDKATLVWTYYDRTQFARYEAKADDNRGLETGVDRLPPQSDQFAKLVDSGPHALSKFNLCPFRLIEVSANLWLTNKVYLALIDYLNQENSLAFNLFMSNLATPIIFSDDDPQFQMSEASYIKLGKDDKFEWCEPAGRSYEASNTRLDNLRQEIYRGFYLQAQGRSSNATASMQSGFSKELDMMPSNDILTCFGDLLRVEMKNVLKMVMLAHDGNTDALTEIQVRGFRFETKPATEAAALADEIQALQIPSRTLEKELQKMVTRNVLEDSGDDVIKKACDEIDAAPTIAEQQQAQGAQMFQQRFDQLNTRQEVRDEIGSTET